jgi:hypothetical protein
MDESAADRTELPSIEDLLQDLDILLDAWFLGEVQPALDEARRARGELAGRSA